MTVMPGAACGPLAGAVMDRLAAWLAAEGYAQTMAPQILGVARGLSAWMDHQRVGLDVLSVGSLRISRPRIHLVRRAISWFGCRPPALRRFLIETGHLSGVRPSSQAAQASWPKGGPVASAAAEQELEEWARWQRDVHGISASCISHRRQWVGEFVESLTRDDAVDAPLRCQCPQWLRRLAFRWIFVRVVHGHR